MKKATFLLVAVLWLLPRPASATEISFLGIDPGQLINVSLAGYNGGAALNTWAGELDWQWKSGAPPGYNPTFYAYCVDLTNAVTSVENVAIRSTNLLTVSGVPDAGGKAAWLFNTYAPTVHATAGAAGVTAAAALQVAIWEALYDTSASTTSGNFRLNGSAAVAAKALEYLTALYSGGTNGYHTSTATWLDAPVGAGQDLMVQMPVPEPASLVLCGMGLLGIARVARRRKTRPTGA